MGRRSAGGGSLAETFVVRVWEPPERVARRTAPALRGVVRHVRSGRSTTFVDEDALLAFLRARHGVRPSSIGGAP